jgi:predicted TIM-barrel fold metal-dependent hydrolase
VAIELALAAPPRSEWRHIQQERFMLSRREFVCSAVAAGAALASQKSTAQPAKRTIVDAQVHLWKAESDDWKWMPGMKPQMPEPFTIEKLVSLMDEAGVDRVVVVPPSWPGDRNDYALEAARRYPDRFPVMGRIPLKNPASVTLLPKWKEQPGMLGVRLTFLGPAAAWTKDGTADWFWPEAEKAGLPVMFLAPGQAAAFASVAERHPRLQLIVDHMGMSPSDASIQAGKFDDVINDTLTLAKSSNVSVKLSAAPNYSKQPYPYRDINPHIERLFDAFGPQRCYWGTDMTNGFDRATYKQRITHFTEQLPFLTESDKDWVMGRAILQRLNWT